MRETEAEMIVHDIRRQFIREGGMRDGGRAAAALLSMTVNKRDALIENVGAACEPRERLTEGEELRLGILEGWLGRDNLSQVVVNRVLYTTATTGPWYTVGGSAL